MSRNDASARLDHDRRRFGSNGELLLYWGGWTELTRD